MNLDDVLGPVRRRAFKAWRAISCTTSGGRSFAFGPSHDQINAILVINLDRQPKRWQRVGRELGRIRSGDGAPLTAITRRLSAVDARDGRAVAATADVDVMYRIGDQLHVQPDIRLAECFAESEPVRMTRQEVAVARSHIEAWKVIADGIDRHVLVLEDDAWFKPRAVTKIDRGWRAALRRGIASTGPNLLYLSYIDAGGAATRKDVCDDLFRPVRGLWHLSGYVLSRDGAAALLQAMPVTGPVDLWMNYRFAELDAFALASPAIGQRPDGASDNVYSILPYLARAGIVDSRQTEMLSSQPHRTPKILAFTARESRERLPMALSMLGLRVQALDGDEAPMQSHDLARAFETFDALVDPPLTRDAANSLDGGRWTVVLDDRALTPRGLRPTDFESLRAVILPARAADDDAWEALCGALGMAKPVQAYPMGAHRRSRLFRDDRPLRTPPPLDEAPRNDRPADESPWVLPASCRWHPARDQRGGALATGHRLVQAALTDACADFVTLVETFPGNLAAFAKEGLIRTAEGTHLTIDSIDGGLRPYRSGAFASTEAFNHGRFEAEIKPAAGGGLITGFFLHRGAPRQEIDIEFMGADRRGMLVNVYFNPGDDGAPLNFGYRGTPAWIDLDFDVTNAFHHYAIDWQPDRISWLVDGKQVHERYSWDPTPIPHLPMRLHANLWAPRSTELAGPIDATAMPGTASFRNIILTGPVP